MNWKELIDVLEQQVPTGSITTYNQVSLWAYGMPIWDRPVHRMIRCARNNGFHTLTNRVVGSGGKLAFLPDRSEQQLQLLNEGIPFTGDGRVDLTKVRPVVLADRNVF